MNTSTIKGVASRAAGTAKNLATGASADVRRQTSIVGRASALIAGAARRTEKVQRDAGAKRRVGRTGVYVLTEEEARAKDLAAGELFRAPDGYLRKTPVQTIKVAPDYNRRIVTKIITGVIIAAIVVAVVYALNMYGVLTF